jgi:hypothetical protein
MKPQKAGIAAIGFGLVCVVLAQAPSYGYPLGVSGNLFFLSVVGASAESPEAAVTKIREVTGVDAQKALALLSYMPAALDQMREATQPIEAATCARRAELTTLPALAEALTKEDLQFEARRAQIVRGAEPIIGAEAMRNLERWLLTKHGSKPYALNDYTELLGKRGVTAQQHLVAKCDVRLGGRR